jgi:hypothetical protein
MTRFVIDAPTLLHLVADGVPVAQGYQLVPGEQTEKEALDQHETMTGVRVRPLGDRVSRRVAWRPDGAAQSAGSSTQSGPLTSPGPARSAASTIVYA